MLTPLDYRDDCEAMLGRLLSHDTQVGDTELAHAFERTKSRWRASHDSSYVELYVYKPFPDAPHRSKAYAGCGSCGWGDAGRGFGLHRTDLASCPVRVGA